jgi:hypothetical protein
VVLRGAQDGAAAERVADSHDGLTDREHHFGDEAVQLREHGLVAREAGCAAEAREVDCQRPLPAVGEFVQHEPPRIGAVGVAVEEDDWRPGAVLLQHPSLEAPELLAVLDQLGHSSSAVSGSADKSVSSRVGGGSATSPSRLIQIDGSPSSFAGTMSWKWLCATCT